MTPSPRLAGMLMICALPVLALAAEDGPLRKLLRERIAERAAQQAEQTDPATRLAADQRITAPGRYEVRLQHNGVERRALIYVPKNLKADSPAPVVMALHGGGGGMIYQANDAIYGLISKADQAGFVAVFPNGISAVDSGMLATWNAGACCAKARNENVDDVGFLRKLVEDVSHRVNIDRNRVFATGMSNGAMMSYRLACDAADFIRAIAAVAGTDNTRSCRPSRPVPVLHIHARDDDIVLFNGGAGERIRREELTEDFVSVPATIDKWVKLNRATPDARRVLELPGVVCERHEAGPGGAPVELCVTETGGHSWPGGGVSRNNTPSSAMRATDVMWEFFSGM